MRSQDARGATGTAAAPLRTLTAAEFKEHERLHGRVYRQGPCNCGDCLSCEVERMRRRAPGPVRELLSAVDEADSPRFVLGAEL